MSIRQRLALGFGVVFVLLVAQMVFSFVQMRDSDRRTDEIVDVINPLEAHARDLRLAYLRQAIHLRSYAVSTDPSDVQAFETAVENAQRARAALESQATDPEDEALLAESRQYVIPYHDLAASFIAAVEAEESTPAIRAIESQLGSMRDQVLAPIETFIAVQQARGEEARLAIESARNSMWISQLLLGAVLIVALIVIAVLTTRAVRDPARRLVVAARALGAGDYSAALPAGPIAPHVERHRDELRELDAAFRRMALDLWNRESRLAAHARVSTVLASTLEVDRLVGEALRTVMEYTTCELGIVYGHDAGSGRLVPLSAVGLDPAEIRPLSTGEGIPGRAAEERSMVSALQIPADAPFQVMLGFDQLPARAVAAAPMEVGENLVGVLVLASVRSLSEEALSFTEQAAHAFAISLANARAHDEISSLAAQLREQNEQLQAQNEEIQAQSEELAQQSEEIQVQNEELQAQNEELETQRTALLEADRQKDEFLAMAVHELRSPVTSIKGTAQLMRRRIGTGTELVDLDRRLAEIDEQSNVLNWRIERLLDVSRARIGELSVHQQPVDLRALVAECVRNWNERSGREIRLETALDRLDGVGDRRMLDQVLDNLIENAIRYSPESEPITIALTRVNGHAHIAVTDNGIGISADALSKVFELYHREPTAAEMSSEGMGLGLYITREIVEAHDGTISVTSTPGESTTFEVVLPLR